MTSLRIVFMGTPDFALPSLEILHQSHHRIVGIVTQPDRPRGRGQKVLPSPVKQYAQSQGIGPILQPERMKDAQFIEALRALRADLFVVVAFRILPEAVFTMPPRGTINLHPSELPKYRGAAPINWTIINGETETAVTTIFIRKEIDAGNIILQKKQPVYPDDTAGSLHERLARSGADLLLESVNLIAEGKVVPRKQDDQLASPAPKLTKEICHLSFAQPARQVKQWIHGLSPYPGGFTFYRERQLKIFRAEVVDSESHAQQPGQILKADKERIWVACQPGIISLLELQMQGKRRLSVVDFLRGNALPEGEILS